MKKTMKEQIDETMENERQQNQICVHHMQEMQGVVKD